jgi:hypothetical protein
MKTRFYALLVLALLAAPFQAFASSISFLGSTTVGGVGVSASAVFDITGDVLTITLRNTSAAHSSALQDVPGTTLTGLFWNDAKNKSLVGTSAKLAAGSSIYDPSNSCPACGSATDLNGEFGYQQGFLAGDPAGSNRGVASSGYLDTGLTGDIGNFNNGAAGTNLQGPASLDGINFGIISAATLYPNGGLSGVPLVRDAMVFMFTGATGLTIADFSNVSFQYGTALNELNVTGTKGKTVPEPASLWLVGAALVGLAGLQKKRSQMQA